ncbi:hypothetical protein ACFOWM_07030 [Ferruginibacter yonginensis]|uniref:DUF1097 domain-containing protein n=1 Tax=Ferruginibacter yonginensis TaxID=1310416 RepID=A0ABV8QRY6_9BACT
MNNEQPFNEVESLRLINEMIGKAKKSYVTKGIASIMWGAIIIFCSLMSWAELYYGFNVGDVCLLTVVAVIPQIYFGIRESKKRGFTSYEGDTLNAVWTAFGISIFIASFYFGSHKVSGDAAAIFMMLYAIPTFITGQVTKFKPMVYGGIYCWVASIASMFTHFYVDFFLMATCGLFAWFIPGIILWNRYQKSRRSNV